MFQAMNTVLEQMDVRASNPRFVKPRFLCDSYWGCLISSKSVHHGHYVESEPHSVYTHLISKDRMNHVLELGIKAFSVNQVSR